MEKGINKGTGLQRFADMNGIDIKEIITFGDNENDNEMLIRSGWGVCLKDGQEITKSVADDITEQTCLEGGVGHYMIDHYLKPNHLM